MKILKWLAIILVVLIVVLAGGVLFMKSKANARLARTWTIEVADVPVPWPLSDAEVAQIVAERRAANSAPAAAEGKGAEGTGALAAGAAVAERPSDEELRRIAMERAIQRGQHIIGSRAGCQDCHGADFGGHVIIDDPAIGKWIAPNITPSGVTKDYQSSKDWVRILRHGINKNGRSSTMPANDFTLMSDQEISDIIAFVSSRPAVDRTMPQSDFGPVHHVLIATGGIPVSAEGIDHTAPRPKTPPAEAPTVEFGKHIIGVCTGCHGPKLSGGPIPGGDPKWPPATNLTPHETGLAKWTKEDFIRSMREGKRPDGSSISTVMPWKTTANMRDDELAAMWLYLSTAPAVPFGNR